MANLVRAALKLVSQNVVADISKIDAESVSSSPHDYVEANLLGYYILINTWLMMFEQWSDVGYAYVLQALSKRGLFALIREFDEAAHQITIGEPVTSSLARSLMRDIALSPYDRAPRDESKTLDWNTTSRCLQLFRYPKRFSPLKADLLKAQSLQGFIQRQSVLKNVQRGWIPDDLDEPKGSYHPFPVYLTRYIREELANLINWDSLVKELRKVDIDDIVFTPGVSFDTDSTLMSKLKSMAREHVEYFPQPFSIPLVGSSGTEEQQFWGRDGRFDVHPVRLIAVPKNYKTSRVIAPENVYRQALARRYFIICDNYLPAFIDLHNQERNQQLAKIGSIDGSLATIDLSNASDSITLTHLYELFPHSFVEIVRAVLPTHYDVDGKRRILQSATTMGNSMTFWIESVLFLAVSLAAVKYYLNCGDASSIELEQSLSVYGDDIIVPTDAAETVIDWLMLLGFQVNRDKSFYRRDNHFRESCGEEYLNGLPLTGYYFPRFPIEGKIGGSFSSRSLRDSFRGVRIDTMTSLIELQHKLYFVCNKAAVFVREVIQEAIPKMTASHPDENLSDPYSYESEPIRRRLRRFDVVTDGTGKLTLTKTKDGIKVTIDGTGKVSFKASGYAEPEVWRDYHYTGVTSYSSVELSESDRTLLDLYNYLQFLRYGPRYEDDLMAILNVSSGPITPSEAAGKPEIKWTLLG